MILFHCFFQVAFTGSTEVGHIIQQAAGASNLKVGSAFKSDIGGGAPVKHQYKKKHIYIGANLERATHL